MRRHARHEERQAPAPALTELPLFAEVSRPLPRPDHGDHEPAPRLVLHNVKAMAYARWRLTADGDTLFRWMERLALAWEAEGRRRIGVHSLMEDARDTNKMPLGNTFQPFIARELVLRHPTLGRLIRLKQRADAR